ncbi:DUF6771 family protein [Sphingomonas bacterium]|uniref:DUF6771 family protein n=1 Tax=Sphingomonas bacterium TaxID=1895847 RepID=UPI0015766A81|nr:DUF6771 family protein [Sphingomonas bacterium]
MSQQFVVVVERVLGRAPLWVRQGLVASDSSVRQRAEEALAAMIGAALADDRASVKDSSSAIAN